MTRLILLAAIVGLIYLLVRMFLKSGRAEQEKPATEDMVRCARCGLHLPKSESIESGGRYYCGTEHRDADHH